MYDSARSAGVGCCCFQRKRTATVVAGVAGAVAGSAAVRAAADAAGEPAKRADALLHPMDDLNDAARSAYLADQKQDDDRL